MRVAIASDIHGNRQAFEAVIAAAEAAGADELWCLGDLVGYGAEPDACVALADAHCAICLAGNHDLAVVEVLSLEDFSRGAALAADWTREVISQETREYLLSLQPQCEAEGLGLFHASPRDPVWEYVLSGARRRAVLRRDRLPDLLHRPLARGAVLPPARGRAGDRHDAARGRRGRPRERRVADQPGLAGQPRDGDARAAWLMLDTGALDRRRGGAPSTTSRAPRRRSARRTCRIRSPSGSNTGSDRRTGR